MRTLSVVYGLILKVRARSSYAGRAGRPPGAPQRTRQPRVRSRLRSEESARTGAPAAKRQVDERLDMIAPVMVMTSVIDAGIGSGKWPSLGLAAGPETFGDPEVDKGLAGHAKALRFKIKLMDGFRLEI